MDMENCSSNPTASDMNDSEYVSKPIKKKEKFDEEFEEGDSLHEFDMEAFEIRARNDMISHLQSKGIDFKPFEDFVVHIQKSKPKRSKETGISFSVTYVSPDGCILTSKSDVVHALKQVSKLLPKVSNHREDIYLAAHDKTMEVLNKLPATFGDHMLVSLGTVDPRSSFYNAVQIFPVGYKSELVVTRGSKPTLVTCEIIDVEGDPEFLITVKSTGQTYIATSEASAWKKFDPSFADGNCIPSFFNLEIELLIEGLSGSFDCDGYKYHAERGYGLSYTSNEQSIAIKNSYLLKSGRERRNQERQRQRFVEDTIPEKDENERDGRHRGAKLPKDREEALKRKEAAREAIKQQKDSQRKNELDLRERARIQEKETRDKNKVEEKVKLQMRKDIKVDLKKLQNDCSQCVLDFYDKEVDMVFRGPQVESWTAIKGVTLSEFLNSNSESLVEEIPNVDLSEYIVPLLEISNCLHLFRHHLNLQVSTDLKTISCHLRTLLIEEEKLPLDNLNYKESEIFFERIQLCIVNALKNQLEEALTESIPNDGSAKVDKIAVSLPLNQLTWTELCRILVVHAMFVDMGKTREEIQCAIRGGRHVNVKATTKNMIRYIRYRLSNRTRDDAISRTPTIVDDEDIFFHKLSEFDYEQRTNYAFSSEDEILSCLLSISTETYHDAYAKCARVFLKIFNTTQAKNLLWEVDQDAYPDYYKIIMKPISFSNVAARIYNREYGPVSDKESETRVLQSFYCEMRQVLINCLTFNTEATYLYIQAQKLLNVLNRHMQRWIWEGVDSNVCDEQHCLWSYKLIPSPLKMIRCGRCFGIFSLDKIFDEHCGDSDVSRHLFLPSQDQIDQSHEDWFCPFCVSEDSVMRKLSPNSSFFINEWGASALIPWIFNPKHSSVAQSDSFHHLNLFLRALQVLIGMNNAESSSAWSALDRLRVLQILCRILTADSRSNEYLNGINSNIEKIQKVCAKTNFREAEFIKVARDIVGDEGVQICRNYLRDVNDKNTNNSGHSRAILGRCVYCNGSTYENDIGQEVEVVLCDGCDGEAHLKCTGLEQVPSSEWFCSECSDNSKKINGADCLTVDFDDVRDKYAEEDLINKLISSRAQYENDEFDADVQICEYCGLSEMDLCSPIVYGQSKEEHSIYIKRSESMKAANVIQGHNVSVVKFVIDGICQDNAVTSFPYFPKIFSEDGQKLREIYDGLGRKPVVVHEYCALLMFQARMNKKKHELRRQRKTIGNRVVAMTGLNIAPLGRDDEHNYYWKFPNSLDLFVSSRKNVSSPLQDCIFQKFRKISDKSVIMKIIDILDGQQCSVNESELKQNILIYVIQEREYLEKIPAVMNGVDNGQFAHEDFSVTTMACRQSSRRASLSASTSSENTPAAIKFLADKGLDIASDYEIPYEGVFEEISNNEDETASFEEYFTYTKNKYFAVAIVNNQDRKLKFPKGKVTVVYQIHREGIFPPIAYIPLSEQWSDNIYYFSAISFKRSGRYTISFIAEGSDEFLFKIDPIIFNITVKANRIIIGPQHALGQLLAKDYMHSTSRLIVHQRRELMSFCTRYDDATPDNELEAVKSALLTIYVSLPVGALLWNSSDSTDSSQDRIAECSGWNDFIDLNWRETVMKSDSPIVIMESLLFFEYFLNKSWLRGSHQKLLNLLPLPQFAMRCVTVASVALRVFAIDRMISYDKIEVVSRATRKNNDDVKNNIIVKPRQMVEIESSEILGRTRRQASFEATNRIKQISTDVDELEQRPKRGRVHNLSEDSESDVDTSISKSTGGWNCVNCRSKNDLRARSCQECGYKKPPISDSAIDSTRETRSRLRGNSRKRKYVLSDEDEDISEEEAEFSSEEEEFNSKRSRKSKRVQSSISEGIDEVDVPVNFEFDFESTIDSYEESLETTCVIKYLKILQTLYMDERSQVFWSPVNSRLNPTYLQVISSPMDLGTITNYVMSDYYADHDDLFAKDIRLVWENCKKFNHDSSIFYQYAMQMSELFESCYTAYFSKSNLCRDINLSKKLPSRPFCHKVSDIASSKNDGWTQIKLNADDVKNFDDALGVFPSKPTVNSNRRSRLPVKDLVDVIDAKVKGFLEINPVVCSGCGAPFQSKTIDAPGYLSKDKFIEHKENAFQIKEYQNAIRVLFEAGIDISSPAAEKLLREAQIPENTIVGVKLFTKLLTPTKPSERTSLDISTSDNQFVKKHSLSTNTSQSTFVSSMCVCQRCFKLEQYGSIEQNLRPGWSENSLLTPERFEMLLSEIATTKAIVLCLVDIFDLAGSLVTNLKQIAGQNPIVIAANKIDLLPTDASEIRVKKWLLSEIRSQCDLKGPRELNQEFFERKMLLNSQSSSSFVRKVDEGGILHSDNLHLVSCRNGKNMDKLFENVFALAKNNGQKVYIIGAANSGKSSVIHRLLEGKIRTKKSSKVETMPKPTVSNLPGTTLDFIKIRLQNGVTIIDTPGLLKRGQLTSKLTMEELKKVVPDKPINAITLRVSEGKAIMIGGLANIELVEGRPVFFTFYVSNDVKLHPTDGLKTRDVIEKHIGTLIFPPNTIERYHQLEPFDDIIVDVRGDSWKEAATDIVIAGLGWVSVTGPGMFKIKVTVPHGTDVSMRKALLPYDASCTTATFTGGKLLKKSRRTKGDAYGWRA